MDRDEMSNLYRGLPIDYTYQVLVHLAKGPIRNKNCLWQPCLLMDQDKMSQLYRGPCIDASYQVSVHLAKGFQRLKCEKLTDHSKSLHCLWQGKLKIPMKLVQLPLLSSHLHEKVTISLSSHMN